MKHKEWSERSIICEEISGSLKNLQEAIKLSFLDLNNFLRKTDRGRTGKRSTGPTGKGWQGS
jgi:hypothetical protein